jgi:hypothetical protein
MIGEQQTTAKGAAWGAWQKKLSDRFAALKSKVIPGAPKQVSGRGIGYRMPSRDGPSLGVRRERGTGWSGGWPRRAESGSHMGCPPGIRRGRRRSKIRWGEARRICDLTQGPIDARHLNGIDYARHDPRTSHSRRNSRTNTPRKRVPGTRWPPPGRTYGRPTESLPSIALVPQRARMRPPELVVHARESVIPLSSI